MIEPCEAHVKHKHQPPIRTHEVGMRDGDSKMVHQLRAVFNRDGAQRVRRAIALLDRITNAQV
ncbi:hypothetical protein HC891_20165, partial [Candidatus Gracilibacteria bacterium]|nr:hypothetical protein [Candidatus Gracilibacteria bacterium]